MRPSQAGSPERCSWPSPEREHGQATVELVGAIPAVLVLGAVAFHALAAVTAGNLAQHAAEAGAVALQAGDDPRAAVADSLPDWPAERLHVAVAGRRVTVELRPRALHPELGAALERSATAHAGPTATPPATGLDWWAIPGGDGRGSAGNSRPSGGGGLGYAEGDRPSAGEAGARDRRSGDRQR